MVCLYFGLPGSGKTTVLTQIAYKYANSLFPRYKNVFHNVKSLKVPGTTYIDNDKIGTYDLSNSLILIDEATLFADSRDYKNFSKDLLEFFLEHRHYHCDIFLFTQQWDGVDRKIRVITDRVYYVYKGAFTRHFFSKYYRIPYGIIIPDPKKNQQSLGEIIQGYCKPNLLARLFCTTWVYRPKYYPYYDSFEIPRELKKLPIEVTRNKIPISPSVKYGRSVIRKLKKRLNNFLLNCRPRRGLPPATTTVVAEPRTSRASALVGSAKVS